MDELSPNARPWMQLSLATVQARRAGAATSMNTVLEQAAADPSLRELKPALLLWVAENFFAVADFPSGIEACKRLRQHFRHTEWGEDSFFIEARSHRRSGDIDAALRVYDAVAEGTSQAAPNGAVRACDAARRRWPSRGSDGLVA